MKGVIIINRSGLSGQKYQANRLKEELEKLGVQADIVCGGAELGGEFGGEIVLEKVCDFAVFLDKDKYLAEMLSKKGIRLFNSAKAIRLCDDKGETCLALAGKGLNIPDTLFAPLVFKKDDASREAVKKTVAVASKKLGFPVVVKESYGSMGSGVYLAKNEAELYKISDELSLKPHIYQKYLSARKGTDVRVIVIGGRFVCAMERFNPDDFRSNLALGGSGRKIVPEESFKKAAEKAARVLKLDYCGVDLLYGDNGEPFICEVNSNAFFKGAESVTGVNVAKIYAEYIIKTIKKEKNRI